MAHVHAPGLVLRMDPDELLKHGARCSGEPDQAVHAQHYFVCVQSDAKEALWVPLFTGPRVGTREIPDAARTGDSRWVGMPAHFDPAQIWRAPHKAAQLAATAAHDRSSPKQPNRVAAKAVPAAGEFPTL